MIDLADFRVAKNGQPICAVPLLHVDVGARLVLLGANGSGKTTLLRALAGLERDFTGTCAVAAPRRERVFVHQNPYLLRGTVLFNVMYGLRARGRDRTVAETHARAWLDRLGIAHLAGRRTGHLSGGETRRVALARAFVLEPRLLLLDEPFAEMDADGTDAVCAALGHLPQATVLIASPLAVPADLPTVAYRITSPAN